MFGNKPVKMLIINLSVIEMNLPEEMIISHGTKCPATHLEGTGTIAVGACKSLNLLVDEVTAATIRQPLIKVSDLNFAVKVVKAPHSTAKNQELFLSRPVNTKQVLALRQQDTLSGDR